MDEGDRERLYALPVDEFVRERAETLRRDLAAAESAVAETRRRLEAAEAEVDRVRGELASADADVARAEERLHVT